MPLTPTQENELLDFMQNDLVYAKYYDEVVILLETGLRISELCGLTPADLNFEKRFVNVDHQLLRSTEDGYYIEAPKTESGFLIQLVNISPGIKIMIFPMLILSRENIAFV